MYWICRAKSIEELLLGKEEFFVDFLILPYTLNVVRSARIRPRSALRWKALA